MSTYTPAPDAQQRSDEAHARHHAHAVAYYDRCAAAFRVAPSLFAARDLKQAIDGVLESEFRRLRARSTP